MDWFTPFNQQELNSYDADLGSGGPVLLPDQPSLHRHLLIVAGKGGVLYVLDRDQMGKYHSGSNLHVVDSIPFGNSMAFGAPAYWNGHLFVVAADHGIEDFPLRREMLSRNPAVRGSHAFNPGRRQRSLRNGSKDGIVWARRTRSGDHRIGCGAARVRGAERGRKLYNSEQAAVRDRARLCLRFTIPTVANGRVFVGAKRGLDVYGLLQK